MKNFLFSVCVAVIATACHQAEKNISFKAEDIAIIPKPAKMQLSEGGFTFTPKTVFVANDSLRPEIELFTKQFTKASGWELGIQNTPAEPNSVTLSVEKNLPAEAYKMQISPQKIQIQASDRNGFIYALQSLRLLLPPDFESPQKTNAQWVVPALTIEDAPQYAWRGLMLDVARHFFPKEYILKTLDRMAMLKLNTFHFHLVDNEGWRIEIKKYPKLTQVGAWRVDQENKHWNARTDNDPNEKGTYGGFYTQEDIKEIVAYAAQRGIRVVPEIEMPAHVMSAIAAYPELSCHERPIAVPSGGVWPITDIYCAGKEHTFAFLEDVLTEVMQLFPSEYLHIGGDEATHTEWEKCPLCQKRMKQEKLKNPHELQSYFIKRIEKFLHSKGKRLIGWDEIIEGGLPQNAIIMNWRGLSVAQKAIEQGHQIILTSDCYIDQYQGLPDAEPLAIGGYLPLSKLYSYSLEREQLTPEQNQQILGSQANLWAEYIPDEKHSEYMIFPRLLALSEIVWSPAETKNWEDFSHRVNLLFPRLEKMGINYAKSVYQVTPEFVQTDDNSLELTLRTELPNAEIRYVLNGEDWAKAKTYSAPIQIKENTHFQAATFLNGKRYETILSDTISFHKAVGKNITFSPKYHKNYQGQGDGTLTNVIRGTKNFHDKQWLAWLVDDATITLDLGQTTPVEKVVVGAMENQGSGIYFPVEITVFTSTDNKNFTQVAQIQWAFQNNGYAELKDFSLEFPSAQAQYIKLKIKNLAHPPKGGDAWLFIDEIQVF